MGAVDLGGGKERGPKKGKRKKKRIPVKIDMTPMVDIAFLLLIFFMVTAVFRTPQALEINLPPKDVQIPIAQSNILTLRVLPGSRIFWNSGEVPPAPITIDKLAATLKDANARNTKLVVLIKGTFEVDRGEPRMAENQRAIRFADEPWGDPATTPPKYPCDACGYKAATDVVVVAKGYAPGGKAVTTFDVAVRVETLLVIVEREEGLAEAVRAADVRREHCDALREDRLVVRAEHRTLLPFRPAVEAQHDRTGLLEAFRQIQPTRQLEPILCFVFA